jgi:hypothetical protein
MQQRILVIALSVISTFGAVPPAVAAEDAALGKDLTATIALQGKPCGQVVNAKRNGDSDYTATCKDGNRYHVFVNTEGRVVVDKE